MTAYTDVQAFFHEAYTNFFTVGDLVTNFPP